MAKALTRAFHFSCFASSGHENPSRNLPQTAFTSRRRAVTGALLGTALLGTGALCNSCFAFDFRMTVPDQTLEEAELGIRVHARDLLRIRPLIETESWKEAQKELRASSANLKQDLYTIIQGRPGNQRPPLRKLYSKLFNSVTRLDYAARSKDAITVRECYDVIVETLDEIFSMI